MKSAKGASKWQAAMIKTKMGKEDTYRSQAIAGQVSIMLLKWKEELVHLAGV